MSDTKTLSINDTRRPQAFGQNVELCAHIKGRTLESVTKGARIPTSLLNSFISGKGGVLTSDMLEDLSFELGLTGLQLIGTHGTVERKTLVFKELFGMIPSTAVEIHDYDHSLMRRGRSNSGQIGIRHGDPSEEREAVAEKPVALEPQPEEQLLTASTCDAEIQWGRDGYSARCGGTSFDFKNKRTRRVVFGYIKQAQSGKLSGTELTSRLRPPKKASWMSNLNNGVGELNQQILEQVARLCHVSVTFLLTGQEPSLP